MCTLGVSGCCSDDLRMLNVSFDADAVAGFAEHHGIGEWAREGIGF